MGDETRIRLLKSAGEIFARDGFEAATIREICVAAGANVASVSFHFGGKKNLYIEAVRYAHDGAQGPLPPPDVGLPPEQRLRLFVFGMLAHLFDPGRPPWHMQLMLRELAHPTEAYERLVDVFIAPMAKQLFAIVRELVPPGTSEMDVHLSAMSIVGQCLHYRVHDIIVRRLVGSSEHDGYSVEKLANHITRFSLAALGSTDIPSGGSLQL